MLSRKALLGVQGVAKQFMRQKIHWTGGYPGSTLPFFNPYNRYKTTLMFVLYFGSAFAIPFAVVRFRLIHYTESTSVD